MPVEKGSTCARRPYSAQSAQKDIEARLHEAIESLPQLDETRRTQQQFVNTESRKHAELSARLDALKTLQDKVKTDGKLKPWLNKHGLDNLAGLWSKIHIEKGWENALEGALRERLNAIEISRLDMVRGFLGAAGTDAPPAKLAFYTTPQAGLPAASTALPKLADLMRLNDAGQKALFTDWLQGCYTAASFDEALANRSKLNAG